MERAEGIPDFAVEEIADERLRELEDAGHNLWPITVIWFGAPQRNVTGWIVSKYHPNASEVRSAMLRLNPEWWDADRFFLGLPENPLPLPPGTRGPY